MALPSATGGTGLAHPRWVYHPPRCGGRSRVRYPRPGHWNAALDAISLATVSPIAMHLVVSRQRIRRMTAGAVR
jgi:hypothetical protein